MSSMKNKVTSLSALLLSGTMVFSLCTPASAAAEPNTPKEEVVYINLNSDGSVQEINVVNIFELDEAGRIIDYGKYESLRNMTTTDSLEYADDQVTIDTGAGKLYYEGRLDSDVMPWKIDVHYYMDGKEYTGEELAGMSGALKITMSITENTSCKGNFFDNYALQASLSLDTNTCRNIEAPDATVANVGSDKQLTYTILPGKGAEIEITADVTDFETDGISVNGIPLSLDVEVDDEELMDQVTELLDAIEKLDDGAEELKDGVQELKDGAENDLKSGIDSLIDGADTLNQGAGKLVTGGRSLKTGAGSLNSGTKSLDEGAKALNSGIAQVQAGLDALNAQSGTLTEGSAQMKEALEQLQGALNGVNVTASQLEKLVDSSAQIKQGIGQLAAGAAGLQSSVNYQAYKALLAQKGLDLDSLKTGNAEAAAAAQGLLGQADTIEQMLIKAGVSEKVIAPFKSQCVSLANQIVSLLQANNACIAGTESYLNSVSGGIDSLVSGAEELKTNYESFDAAIGTLAGTLSDLMFNMTQLKNAVNTLVKEYSKLDTGLTAYTDGVTQVVAGYKQVSKGASSLAAGSGELRNGSGSLYSGTAELLNGIVELYEGTGTLVDGTGQLDEGAAELISGIAQLYDGTGEMKDGTGEMRSETDGMDTEITDKIDELLESVSGGDAETVSFVSEQNKNVESVQFVIQSEGLAMEDAEPAVVEETESLNAWQKFLRLFGAE